MASPSSANTPRGSAPFRGAPPLVRVVAAGARLPGSGRGRAVTGAPADANAFAVSAGPAREAAWKKAQCWEPGRQRQEKQPPFGGTFQAVNEINTARCRAARPHSAGQGAPAVHPCSPPSGETEARPGGAAWSWWAARGRTTGFTPCSPHLAGGRGGRGAARRHGQWGHAAERQAAGDGSLVALGGWEGSGHPTAGLGRWVRDGTGRGGAVSVAVLPGIMLGPGRDARSGRGDARPRTDRPRGAAPQGSPCPPPPPASTTCSLWGCVRGGLATFPPAAWPSTPSASSSASTPAATSSASMPTRRPLSRGSSRPPRSGHGESPGREPCHGFPCHPG